MSIAPASRWFPVAASTDLPVGHVYQTRLDGQGLAIWRAADGRVNIWEDRCPHRGVRFSIGTALGEELRCQYHAWRFASGSGACTHIPAHPDRTPAGAIRAQVWPAAEQGGLVWTTGADEPDAPPPVSGTILRAMPVDRPATAVKAALEMEGFAGVQFFVQPVDPARCVIRGVADGALSLPMLRSMDATLGRFRHRIEAA